MDSETKIDPHPPAWSDLDKCLLWLGIVVTLYGTYLCRVYYLLAHPAVEPYFDRHALGIFGTGMLVATLAAALLFVIALGLRRRASEGLWLLHGANMIWWVWTSISVYGLGPLTTPVIGLLLLGGSVSIVLFSRRVIVPAMASGLSILVVTTLAERAELLPYAPLFRAHPGIGGSLPSEYVVGTSIVALVIVVTAFLVISYLVEGARARERALLASSRAQERARAELQRAMESLRTADERFRQLAENTREVFWLMELGTGKLLYVSPPFERIWQMPCSAIYERPERFLERVHPDDRDRVAEQQRVVATGWPGDLESAVSEYRLVVPDGTVRWVSIRAFPVRDSRGRIYRLAGLVEDITERHSTRVALRRAREDLEQRIDERTAELSRANQRLSDEIIERKRVGAALKRSETQLREEFSELENLYQRAPIGLCLFDAELRYLRINERLAAAHSRPIAEHIGRTLADVMPQLAETIDPIVQGVLDSGEAALDIEVHGTSPAAPQTERHWLSSYFPLESTDGTTLAVSVVVQDISELKWAQDRARRHLESLAHVARINTMERMATGIAHELNQPLASIANYAYVGKQALSENSVARATQMFDELLTQSLRAGEILQHLRAFVNKTPMQRTTVSVNGLIEHVVSLMDGDFRSSGVEPVLALDSGLPEVCVDSIQVQQVILNLVRNALDAMAGVAPPRRSLKITSTSNGNLVEVAVSDSGIGLSANDLERVFEDFYTTRTEGMGMGLSISRSIIEAHGGRLQAEANPGPGMTFRFTLREDE